MWADFIELLCQVHVAKIDGSVLKYLSTELTIKRLGFS
jgi:hypothetical protein